jgi:hypothetical protein
VGQQRYAMGARVVGVVVLALVAGVLGLGPASAAPGAAPAPVRQVLAEAHHRAGAHASTGTRQALRLPGDDVEAYLFVNPRCAPGQGKATLRAGVDASAKVKLDWVLTGGGVRKTGTVKVKKVDRDTSISLPKLRKGSYRLTLALHGKTALVADQTFDVLPCVVVRATCRAVTFTNPAGNPVAEIVYGGHKKSQQFTLSLEPGASRTVRADYSKIDYDIYGETDEDLADLGRATVKVKQKCRHDPALPGSQAIQTSGFASCSAQGAPAPVTLGWSVQPSVSKATYEVRDAGQQLVASGKVKGGREADVGLAPGTYTYRSLANQLTQPFEELSFSVYACVQVTPRCRAVEVENPNAATLGVLLLSVDEEETEVAGDGDLTTLPAHQTVTIPWTGSSAWVLALAQEAWDGSTPFLSLASSIGDDGDPLTVEVPQNC